MGEDNRAEHIKKYLNKIEKNIELITNDPVALGGFTQVPNFILDDPTISIGAKITYAKFLSYAWNDDCVFPGQDTLGKAIGMSRSRVSEYVKELREKGLIEVKRRGLTRTNLYRIHFRVANSRKRK